MPYPSPDKPPRVLFIELQTVDSTNNYALSKAHAGLAQHGMAVFSHEQLAGKGQRGKTWKTAKGQNIALSLLLQPGNLQVQKQFELSASIAVAVHHSLRQYLDDNLKIKWPNDIYWQDRKAGGILIENVVQGTNWKWTVAGIGINVNQTNFSAELANPVSLKQITGKTFEVTSLARKIATGILEAFETLQSGKGNELLAEYRSHLYKLGENARFKKDNRVFEATVKDISPSGKLILQHKVEEEFTVGEINWIID